MWDRPIGDFGFKKMRMYEYALDGNICYINYKNEYGLAHIPRVVFEAAFIVVERAPDHG